VVFKVKPVLRSSTKKNEEENDDEKSFAVVVVVKEGSLGLLFNKS